jgi:hypothetical protein
MSAKIPSVPRKNSDGEFGCLVICTLIGIVLIVAVCAAVGWYRASVQAEVYRREGIEMSTWEVLVGARPAERTINLK